MTDPLSSGTDGPARCAWCIGDPLYERYHDLEWGRPSADDDRLFEKLSLEGFQAGLSWITILRKRDAFRRHFEGFAVERVAALGDGAVERMLADPLIVRHRGKIVSAIANARRVLALREETGASLAAFLWRFEPPPAERPSPVTPDWIRRNPATPASHALSKALRRRGFTFVGPTTLYAFMQSMGFVNDHVEGCPAREACERERDGFVRPR